MHGQRLLVLAIMAAALVLHLNTPLATAKPMKNMRNREGVQLRQSEEDTDSTSSSSTGTGTGTEEEESGDGDAVSAECVISAVNFAITTFNNVVPSLASGIAVCIDACDIGTAECVACIATIIPPIPLIPTDLAGCS